MDQRKGLNLSEEGCTILHWLALLMEHRKLRLSTPMMKRGADWLKNHFLLDVTKYDVIVGYRADDSYFAFARAFVNNEISLKQLSYAMRLGKLGEQVVLKSENVFQELRFLGYEAIMRSMTAALLPMNSETCLLSVEWQSSSSRESLNMWRVCPAQNWCGRSPAVAEGRKTCQSPVWSMTALPSIGVAGS